MYRSPLPPLPSPPPLTLSLSLSSYKIRVIEKEFFYLHIISPDFFLNAEAYVNPSV